MNTTFEKVDIEDIPGVSSCMKENNIKNIKDQTQGRIFYDIAEEELKTYIDNKENIFLCAKEGSTIVGYMLAYDIDTWMKKKNTRYDDLNISPEDKETIKKERTLYVRHVAIKREYHGLGIVKQLEQETLYEAKRRGYTCIIAEIMKSPTENKKSMDIHEKVGFKKTGEIKYNDGTIWNVILLKI